MIPTFLPDVHFCNQRSILVTGGAGFIGSHIVRRLVQHGAKVRVLDALTTGRSANLASVASDIEFVQGDVADMDTVRGAMRGIEYVFHLAALVSVPESVEQPERNFAANILGTQNMLLAAREAQVGRFVFTSTCAVYGNHAPPHHEALAPQSLSPYAAAKHTGEQLCRAYQHVYGLPTVALRYFNVFGPGQNPRGGYAAAIPLFIDALIHKRRPTIFGDGRQSRDFVFVENIVDANLLACQNDAAVGEVFNIGTGRETSLLELLDMLGRAAGEQADPIFAPPRAGDVRHSHGDITRAREVLGYRPTLDLADALATTFAWYRDESPAQW